MRMKIFVLLIALVLIFTACTPSSRQHDGTLALLDMEYTLADASDVSVAKFDFGEGELKNNLGKAVPCPLEGIIAVPAGEGPHPLVVVFHGVKSVKSVYDDVYSGFDYLVRQLAAEGYVAVSFNVNVEYHWADYGEPTRFSDWAYEIYKQQMALLERANKGQESGHGVDLQGKIDFEQIHLMGHSRGGEIADEFYRMEQADGKNRIRSILAIAPGVLPIDQPRPNIPIGIILGELDGDTSEDGQILYDTIRKEPGRVSPVSFVYLRGANHAYFNREFVRDDARTQENWHNGGKRLTREQQEDFLMRYASAFLSVYAKGTEPFGIWNPNEPQPVTMFDYAVTASSSTPEGKILVTPSKADLSLMSAEVKASIDYILKTFDDDILFNHPGGTSSMNPDGLPLYSVQWQKSGGEVKFPASGFAGYNALTLYVAVDSPNDLNPKGKDQSFTVTLSDASGATQSILIPKGTSALAWHEGDILDIEQFDGVIRMWDGLMPLGGLRIPLALFDEIDLASVSEIALVFDQTNSGAVMLSGIYLEK